MTNLKRLALALLLVVSACTSSNVQVAPQQQGTAATIAGQAGPRASHLVLLPAQGDATTERYLPFFEQGFRSKFADADAAVLIAADSPQAVDAIRLQSRITEIDLGNAAMRFLVGFGAGRQKVSGAFRILDPQERTLAEFQNSESYAGGAGIGGLGMLTIEELTENLGKSTGSAVKRWMQGGPLKAPEAE